MRPDPPIDEIREIRRQISAEHGHDPHRLGEYYRELQEQYKDRMISPGSVPAKTSESVEVADEAATHDDEQ